MNQRGFTLIETVIYIALLGLIMGGCLAAVWGITQGMSQVSTRTTNFDEGGFVIRKMHWALMGASAISIAGSGCNQTLTITRYGSPTTVTFRRNAASSSVEMQEAGGGYYALTTGNASTTCLKFQTVSTGSQTGLAATSTINGIDFTLSSYYQS
jgi:prepilin-type N-terminal cleavage/methylation domain-containing protein